MSTPLNHDDLLRFTGDLERYRHPLIRTGLSTTPE